MKRCPKCGETKPLSEFHMKRRSKDGKYPYCKACVRLQNAKSNPIWSPITNPIMVARVQTTKQAVLALQGGRCAICGEMPAKPHMDHDHSCPKHKGGSASFYAKCSCARGVLCTRCNTKTMAEVDSGRVLPGPAVQYYLDNPPAQVYFELLKEWEVA